MASEYTCTLTKESLARAKKELKEDPKNRAGAVETFRSWINDQKYISCPTDTEFLLSFLRVGKFSQLEARKRLQKFLSRRGKLGHLYQNYDTGSQTMLDILDCGLFMHLPGTDKEGRKVFLLRPGKIDANFKKFSKTDVFRTMGACLDITYFTDENTQVNGTVTVVDFTGYSMKHQTNVSLQDRKDFIGTWQGAYPARIKEMHMYNFGPLADLILTFVKLIMSDKVKKRLVQHGDNLESLYKKVPLHMLPEEYLPDEYEGPTAGPESKLIENMKQLFKDEKNRERIAYISSDKHTIDEKQAPDDVPQASFRKLNVD